MVRLVGVAAVDRLGPTDVFANPFVAKQTAIIVDRDSRYVDAAMTQTDKLIVRIDRGEYLPGLNVRCALHLITVDTVQNAIALLDMQYDYTQAAIMIDEQWMAELCDELVILGDPEAEETRTLANTLKSGLKEISAALSLLHFDRQAACNLADLALAQSFEHSRQLFYGCAQINWDKTVTLTEIHMKTGLKISIKLNRRDTMGRTYFLSGNVPGGPTVNVDLLDLRHKYATLAYLLLKLVG